MLTIFTIPKPFQGHIDIIQRNAVTSWTHLRPHCEIILCGDDAGVAEAAREFRTQHLPDVACNQFGTPFLNSAFERVQAIATHPLVCYVNADIILMSDFVSSVQRITVPRFLMVGQRWNLDIVAPIQFDSPTWEQELKAHTQENGALSPPGAIDYFVFRKGTLGELPAFVVGRPGWDNWMLQHAHSLGIQVIDTTSVNMVVHQNHDYGHVPQRRQRGRWDGPEADHNLGLLDGRALRYTLLDSTHVLTDGGVRPAVDYKHLRRRLVRSLIGFPVLWKATRPLGRLLDGVFENPES